MYRHIPFTCFFFFVSVLFGLSLTACGPSDRPHTQAEKVAQNNTPAVSGDSLPAEGVISGSECNNISRLIAGYAPHAGSKLAQVTGYRAWKSYAANLNSRFGKLDSTRLGIMREWRSKELATVLDKEPVLFYPFSGPDFLNAGIFFPEASSYYLFALESPGSLTKAEEFLQDSSGTYFSSIDKSLWSILNFSFFRTNSMKVDLKARDLNGSVHLMVLFAQRLGFDVYSTTRVWIDSTGAINNKGGATSGICVKLLSHDRSHAKSLYYFSADISDSGMLANKGLNRFLMSLGKDKNTYLKSASYLLHLGNFSWMRKYILNNSRNILQDDSGIPLMYVDSSWQKTFYGTYDRPIDLFKHKFQEKLKEKYESHGSDIKPLPFGIGYDYKLNESNLMLFTKQKGKTSLQ